jgi:hypothetical protein
VQGFLYILVPEVPWEVEIQRDRQKFLVSKVIDKVPDEVSSVEYIVFEESMLSAVEDLKDSSTKESVKTFLEEEDFGLRSRAPSISGGPAPKFKRGNLVYVHLQKKCGTECRECNGKFPKATVMALNADGTYQVSFEYDHHRGGCLCWSYYHDDNEEGE